MAKATPKKKSTIKQRAPKAAGKTAAKPTKRTARKASPTRATRTARTGTAKQPSRPAAAAVSIPERTVDPSLRRALTVTWGLLMTLALTGLMMTVIQQSQAPQSLAEGTAKNPVAYNRLRTISNEVSNLEALQTQTGHQVINAGQLEQELANIEIELESNDQIQVVAQLNVLEGQVRHDQALLAAADSASTAPTANPAVASLNVPILLYHKPPQDFNTQMSLLLQRGYTTITLDQLATALSGHAALPTKPVIITFDDGFSAQLTAAAWLAQHNMRATFFIIDGGARSRYCIGAGRKPDPCGDAYMTWDQLRQLDQNPLFTIASHTVDHPDLAQEAPDVQRFEIFEGKHELEQQLGHPVTDFAYPYGAFNAVTLSLVRQAGFVTAVTTVPGTVQTANSLLTLRRVRSTYNLP